MRVQVFDLKSELKTYYNPSFYYSRDRFYIHPHEVLLFVLPQTTNTRIFSWPENQDGSKPGHMTVLVKNNTPSQLVIPKRCNLQTILNKQQLVSQDFFTPEHIVENVFSLINVGETLFDP